MPWVVPYHQWASLKKNRITIFSEAMAVIRFFPFDFGNPAIPSSWDPWLSVPRLLAVWLCRQYSVLNDSHFIGVKEQF
jgi:hypothetical protein